MSSSRLRRRHVWRTMGVCGLALLAGPATHGQLVQQRVIAPVGANVGGGVVNPENFDGKESNDGVYVPESELAMERLALAQKMERLKEWNKSADLYEEILTDPKYASKVVPARQDADHHINQWKSVEEQVMQRLSRWPQEGLDVYRARYEAPAQAMLDAAGPDDLNALHQVFSRYFVTESGKRAGLRLMDHYLQAGEFRAAAVVGDKLLQWHPNVLAERGAIRYRTALAYHLSGDDEDAGARARDLRRQDAQDKGIVRGGEVLLADSLDQELRSAAPVSGASGSADSYLTFGGNVSRDDVPTVGGTPGAHLYSIPLSKPTWPPVPQPQQLEARYREQSKAGLTLGIFPVVDRGELFFQDGRRIYGVNLESGVALAGWQQANGAVDQDGAYTLPNVTGSQRESQLTLTITDRAVLAVMGQPDADLARAGVPAQGETRLVCLDRATGRENWVVGPDQLPQESLRNAQFVGAPLVAGDNVLLAAEAGKASGFEDCLVLCFELNKGRFRWATNVASASTPASAFMGMNPGMTSPASTTHLAYANGRVFVQTNRGAIAAVDAYDGNIAWVDTYHRGAEAMVNPNFNPMWMNGGQLPQNPVKPWAMNPTIVAQGMLFTLPLEGKKLLVYDAASGAAVRQIDLDDLGGRLKPDGVAERDEFDTLVGVIDDKLILAGSHTVAMLNWKTYDDNHYRDDMLYWSEPVFRAIRGRPFLTASSVYVPDEDHLYRMDLKSGVVKEGYPRYPQSWDAGEGPGNVLVTSDHVIIAGADQIDVYTDLTAAKRKLDREVAERAADPQPRLRYAEVMFAAADYDTAMAKLDEAMQRLGAPGPLQPGPMRDRVFNDALTFAQKLRAGAKQEARDRVDQLFDRAAAAASSPEQQVRYRIARAQFEEGRSSLAAAVHLYQQILSDASLRSVPLTDETTHAPASADIVAQRAIATLAARDPSAYAPFERDAAAALQQARDAHDPGRLLDVALVYPNATSAPQALLAAADAYESAGQFRTARHILFNIVSNHAAQVVDWPRVLEALARTDLLVPDRAAGAWRPLAMGLEKDKDARLAQALKLPDGTELPAGTSFAAALERVRKIARQAEVRLLPRLGLPVPRPPMPGEPRQPYPKPFKPDVKVVADVDALVVPAREFARADRIVTWSSAPVLNVYDTTLQKPLATAKGFAQPPKGCAWVGGDLLVWTPAQAAMVKDGAHAPAWSLDLGQLPAMAVIASDAEPDDNAAAAAAAAANNAQPRVNGVVIAGGRQMVMRNGIVMPIAPAAAPAAPNARPAGPEQIDLVVPAGERVLVATTTGRLLAIETATGHIAWQTRLTDRPVSRLVADEDFTAVKVEDNNTTRLVVFDTVTGHVRGTHTFANQGTGVPQNLALSPDGTLVYTLPDRIRLKDLYKPWGDRELERVAPAGQVNFNNMTRPDQLVISDDRILAMTESGTGDRAGEKFVRLYSLETGQPVMLNFNDNQQVERALSAGTKSEEAALRVIGSRLYVVAPDAGESYNLEHPDEHYEIYGEQWQLSTIDQSFIGTDFLLFVGDDPDAAVPNAAAAAAAANGGAAGVAANGPAFVVQPQPAAVPPPPPPAVRPAYELYAFGRYQTPRGESGRLDYQLKIQDPAGITNAWQAVDGGVCYLTADHKLHLLAGAGG